MYLYVCKQYSQYHNILFVSKILSKYIYIFSYVNVIVTNAI